jgi:hypothetical protein
VLRLVRNVSGGEAIGRGVELEPPAPEQELWRQVEELADAVREARDAWEPVGGEEHAPAEPHHDCWPAGDAEEVEEALTEALAFSDLYEVLVMPGGSEEIRRTGHPGAEVVLEAAARVLPDRRMARAARKSALKARTALACG